MKAILVFIDGTICDTRARHPLIGTENFNDPQRILADLPVPGSADCLTALAASYRLVYLGARAETDRSATEGWLPENGFPQGPLLLADSQAGRLTLAREAARQFDFIAGIGDRWDDNELHGELGCLSIILQEFAGDWAAVPGRIERHHRRWRAAQNRTHLAGKVEGLARVCPLLLSKYGDAMWEAYQSAVLDLAERTRPERRAEDLAEFARRGLNPGDLRDAARLDALLREEDWEDNPVYGLQAAELVEATPQRYVHKVTACAYAELWRQHRLAEIGYQIHCRTDRAWWDRPAWNPEVRFEQPQTLMLGAETCLFVQTLAHEDDRASLPEQPHAA